MLGDASGESAKEYQTLKIKYQESFCYIKLYRPEANNTINDTLVDELHEVLDSCNANATVVVLLGLPEVFCFGADFQSIHEEETKNAFVNKNVAVDENIFVNKSADKREAAERIYDLFYKISTGPFITVAKLQGKVNAGGVGIVAACDIVLSDNTAEFSLSEMLFGIFPACVMPFLVRRIGYQKAHYMTIMTKPIAVELARDWGLVDAIDEKLDVLLRNHLLRLRRLTKQNIIRYKKYMADLNTFVVSSKDLAVGANISLFSDPQILADIGRYAETGEFPWQQ